MLDRANFHHLAGKELAFHENKGYWKWHSCILHGVLESIATPPIPVDLLSYWPSECPIGYSTVYMHLSLCIVFTYTTWMKKIHISAHAFGGFPYHPQSPRTASTQITSATDFNRKDCQRYCFFGMRLLRCCSCKKPSNLSWSRGKASPESLMT